MFDDLKRREAEEAAKPRFAPDIEALLGAKVKTYVMRGVVWSFPEGIDLSKVPQGAYFPMQVLDALIGRIRVLESRITELEGN